MGSGDDLSYKLYLNNQKKRVNAYKEQRKAEITSFGVFLAFCCEWYLSAPDGSSKMFIDWLWEQLKYRDPTISHFSVGLVISFIFFAYTVLISWPRETERKIYYPKLARKLRAKEDERKR